MDDPGTVVHSTVNVRQVTKKNMKKQPEKPKSHKINKSDQILGNSKDEKL